MPPAFDGSYDNQVFFDWLSYMDNYFEWYNMSDERRVRFARMKLQGSFKIFWMSGEKARDTTYLYRDLG